MDRVKQISLISIVTALALIAGALPIGAIEITVSGNGDESVNTAAVEQTQAVTVTQTNDTTVNNEVATNANTGGNTVESNAGQTTVETGTVTNNVSLNHDLNTNAVIEDNCCAQGNTNLVISGNGVGSENTVNAATGNSITVSTVNTATVINSISGSMVTGNNQVNNTQGEVTVITGDIGVSINLVNQANQTKIKDCCGALTQNQVEAKIVGNGSDSVNLINYADNQFTLVNQNNNSFLTNNLWFDLVTGNNQVNNSSGEVFIKTGDIVLNVVITNQTNENIADIGCCEETPVVPPPDDHNPPPTPPIITEPPIISTINPDTGKSDPGPSSAGVGGQVLGAILPATGSGDMMWMLIANLLTFLFGCYLRRYSGRAPARV